jgi:hypothetical protein
MRRGIRCWGLRGRVFFDLFIIIILSIWVRVLACLGGISGFGMGTNG